MFPKIAKKNSLTIKMAEHITYTNRKIKPSKIKSTFVASQKI